MSAHDPIWSPPEATESHLRILATSDLHAHLMAYDYFRDQDQAGVGLFRLADEIAALRDAAPNCLLLDNGDTLQGTPLGDLAASRTSDAPAGPHPMIAAMNALAYDAATLGNHDLDFGLPVALDACRQADFPIVSASLRPRDQNDNDPSPFARFVILDRNLRNGTGDSALIKIAVFGVLPPQTAKWNAHQLGDGFLVPGLLPAARKVLSEIEAHQPDLVIALAHTGIGTPDAADDAEDAALALAGLAGIDVVIAGHSHGEFPPGCANHVSPADTACCLDGKPAVQPGYAGNYLGLIDLKLARHDGRWAIRDTRSQLVSAAHVPDPARPATHRALAETARAWHDATRRHVARPIGRTRIGLNNHFAGVQKTTAVQIICDAKRWYLTDPVIKGDLPDLPVLAASAPFRATGPRDASMQTDIAPDELSLRHLFDLYPFQNRLDVLLVPGRDLQQWLERAASLFNRIIPGRADQKLLSPDYPIHGFDMIDGLAYEFDLSIPPRFAAAVTDPVNRDTRRVRSMTYNGLPVRSEDRFLLATNSFRTGGGGNYWGANTPPLLPSPTDMRRIVEDFLAAGGVYDHAPANSWRFGPMPGTRVLIEAVPDALQVAAIGHAVIQRSDKEHPNPGLAWFELAL